MISTGLGGESREVELEKRGERESMEERERKEIIKTKVQILLFYTGGELQ
jgi:hypothetical protein